MQLTGIPQILIDKAKQYGIDPNYMLRMGKIESGFNPNAVSPTGAKGLLQFTGGTAKAYGLDDPFNPEKNADAGARLALDNQRALQSKLGRTPTPGELYMAHQQGAGGAGYILANPGQTVADAPDNIRKNILVNGGTADMKLGDFAGKWTGKFDAPGAPSVTPMAGATMGTTLTSTPLSTEATPTVATATPPPEKEKSWMDKNGDTLASIGKAMSGGSAAANAPKMETPNLLAPMAAAAQSDPEQLQARSQAAALMQALLARKKGLAI